MVVIDVEDVEEEVMDTPTVALAAFPMWYLQYCGERVVKCTGC